MGGFANYCVICGLPMGAPDLGAFEGLEHLQNEQVRWLDDIRLIGENPKAQSLTKIFIARAEAYDDDGWYDDVSGDDDPNFWSEDDVPDMITAFDWDLDYPILFPFHQCCLELFQHKLGSQHLDRAALYKIMRDSFPKKYYGYRLKLDWGQLDRYQDQYFYLDPDGDYFAFQPTAIPPLADYYGSLPILGEQASPFATAKVTSKSPQPNGDVFARLSVEVALLIMSHCNMRDVTSLRAASPAALRVGLPSSFWKHQLIADMPWLYDFPKVVDSDITKIDWPRVYKDLLSASENTSKSRILGLVNRRRIWQLTDQLTDPYLRIVEEKLLAAIKTGYQPAAVLQGVTSSTSRLLTESEPDAASLSSLCFVREFSEAVDHEPVLSLHWNDQGALCGLSSRSSLSFQIIQGDGLIGLKKHSKTSEDVVIPKDDWISGLVTTSRTSNDIRSVVGLKLIFTKHDAVQLGNSEGDQRLFRVAKSKVLVGFHGGCAPDGRLSKLSLLSQPPSKFPGGVSRIKDKHEKDYNAQCQKHLWARELPSPGLNIGKPESGYWSTKEARMDLMPAEALVFGRTEEELADMTAISGDVHLGGFEIEYGGSSSNRRCRTIGPRLRHVKTLRIDGAGGERITGVYTYTTHIVTGIRFVTNRRRQLVIGLPIGRHPSQHTNPPGIFASWESRSENRTQLAFIGGLSSTTNNPPTTTNSNPTCDPPMDSHSYPWEPCSPLADSLIEKEPIWGHVSSVENVPGGGLGIMTTLIQRRGDIPGDESVVTYLDLENIVTVACSSRLVGIDATLCHGIRADYLPLAGLRFRYENAGEGEEKEKGFGPEIRELGQEDEPCWCGLGSRKDEEQKKMPHFRLDTWDLTTTGGSPGGGRRLGAMRLWLNGQGVGRLAAVQFVAVAVGEEKEEEEEGPIWGYGKEGGYDETVTFDSGGGDGVTGLKFYMGDNDRATTYSDCVVNAIQGMRRNR